MRTSVDLEQIQSDRHTYLEGVDLARRATQAYYGTDGEVVLDDPTFDALIIALRAAEAAHPDWTVTDSPTTVVGAATPSGKTLTHSAPMLSLDNLFTVEGEDPYAEVDPWVAGREKALGRPISAWTVEPKYDGSACSARYENGRLVSLATRGDGTTGEDRWHALERIVGIPHQLTSPFTGEVRGEILFLAADYQAASEARVAAGKGAYANARNAAAGAFGADSLAYPVRLTFFPYAVVGLEGASSHSEALAALAGLGFEGAGSSVTHCATAAEVKAAVAAMDQARPTLDHEIDGAVIKVDAYAEQRELGTGSRAPRWGVAFKYPPDTAIGVLEEVTWAVGRTGIIAPRARISPTFVGGTTVRYATLHNVADIARKGFMLHDHLTVKRAGEVIPRLEAPVISMRTGNEVEIDIPAVCPNCGAGIDKSQERWRCERGRACNALASVEYAVSRDAFDIEGAGYKRIAQMVEAGLVADIGDVFALTREQLLTLERMGETSADNLLAQIEGAKAAPLARVFTALGVRGTGRSLSRRIARHFKTMEAIQAASAEDFEAVDGIGPEKAPWIVEELAELAEVIEKLRAAGVVMPAEQVEQEVALPLAGMTVVVTGSMSGPLEALSRTQVNELIERAGGKSSGSVSAKTSLLVAGEKAGSKLEKARGLGVEVDTPEEFAQRVSAFL